MFKQDRKKHVPQRRSIPKRGSWNDRQEKPISGAYPEIDNDLARDNLENDIPAPDLPG
ncbi:MAG: hypothetical protein ACI3VN_05380 [Candidatus Onthomonas sp.]